MATCVYYGTELKLNIGIEPIDGVSMESYDFNVEILSNTNFGQNKIVIKKEDAIKVDSDNYIVTFDTSKLQTGNVICKIIAHIPDSDFKDGYRTEIAKIDTGIKIVKIP